MTVNGPIKLVVASVLIICIVVLFWMFDWQKKQKEIEEKTGEIPQLQVKLDEQKKLVEDLPALTKEKNDLEKKLQEVMQTNLVPEKPEMFVANYLKEIEKMISEENYRLGDESFEILSIAPGALTGQAAPGGGEGGEEGSEILKQFPTRVFQMSMRGRYSTIIEFLYQLGDLRLERLVTINSISLTPGNSDGTRSPVLSIQMPITAYMKQGG